MQLSSVCERITSGGTPSRKISEYFTGNIPWVKTQELLDRWIDDTDEHITPSAVANSSSKLLPANTVLMAMYGATVGQLGLLRRPMTCNQAAIALVVDPSLADFRYIYYQLLHSRQTLRSLANGAAQQNLSGRTVADFEVPVPPLAEQRAIAGVLGSLDDKIESNRRLISVSKEVIGVEHIRTLEFAEGEQRFADMYSRAERVVQTGPFGSNLHASDYEDNGVPLVLVKHVLEGEIALDGLPLIGVEKVKELTSYRLKTNDIVLTRVGRIGDVALVPRSQDGWLISGQMLRIRIPDGSIIPSWLAQWFLGAEFLDRIAGYSVGSTRMSLSTGILMEIPFPNVPIEVQEHFDARTMHLRERITKARAENATLSEVRDSLLPELLSGRLRVKDVESIVENV